MSNNSSRITPNVPTFPNQAGPGEGCTINALCALKEQVLWMKLGSRSHNLHSRKMKGQDPGQGGRHSFCPLLGADSHRHEQL